jgi:inner membrane protein involved in colicin E2 resistance
VLLWLVLVLLLLAIEDHVWFEDRWMVASWCDE